MDDNELLLVDRIAVIQAMKDKNMVLSFSGGKDSTVLHYLLDMALPNNNIPRVFIDTGIEFNAIRKFIYDLASKDKRIIILKPQRNIKSILTTYGYPFKSKEHSQKLSSYQKNGEKTKAVRDYIGKGTKASYLCPKILKYQFTPQFNIKVSDLCCSKLKKETFKNYIKSLNDKDTITITGMRISEGGLRGSHKGHKCIFKDKFHPLFPISEEWENWFISKYNIRLCELYYPPYNFKRTGCKGCPFNIKLQEELDIMKDLLPNEYKQCEIIWKPIYDEYRRIGYRLKHE